MNIKVQETMPHCVSGLDWPFINIMFEHIHDYLFITINANDTLPYVKSYIILLLIIPGLLLIQYDKLYIKT